MTSLRTILIATGAAWIWACSVVHKDYDERLRPDELAFAVGETRLGDVLRALGPPARLSSLDRGGLVFQYEHLVTSRSSFGIEGDSSFAFLDVSGGGAELERETLLLDFDAGGVLRDQAFRTRRDDLSSGLGASFLVAADRFVGTKAVEDDVDPEGWGLRLLDPPFATLNEPCNLGTGESGLQQRGTSEHVGQHTLELR